MSVTAAELKLYQATTMGSSFSTANIGGAISATEITGGSIGEVLFTMGSNALGGGTRTQYEKCFFKNTNASLPLTNSVIYIKNSLDVVTANGFAVVVSDSATDNNLYKITVLGFDASANPQTEDIILNGTTSASGALTFSKIHRCEYRVVSSGLLGTAVGNITITRGSALGAIPAGYKTATGEIDIGLVATLNDSGTTADPSIAPGGISFSRPRTVASGIAVANGQSLTNGSGQAVWCRWVLGERSSPSSDVSVVMTLDGQTA